MPLIGISCAKHGDVTFRQALEGKCNCYPRFLLDTIFETQEQDYHKGDIITATTLLGCMRETYLQRQHDYYAPVESLYYSWRGHLIHTIFERPKLDGWVSEKIFSKTIATKHNQIIAITGKVDGYDKPTLTLNDLKTIGDNGLIYVVRDGAKDEHIAQVNIYRWLCPYKVERLRIVYLTMMTFAETGKVNEITQSLKKDPDKKKKKFEYFIPPTEVHPSGYGNYRIFYQTPEIEIWSDDKVVEFIRPRAEILLNAFKKGVMPPKCNTEMQEWRCARYCHVCHFCKEYEDLLKKECGDATK